MQAEFIALAKDLCSICSRAALHDLISIYYPGELSSDCALCSTLRYFFLSHPILKPYDIEKATAFLYWENPKRRTRYGLYPRLMPTFKLNWDVEVADDLTDRPSTNIFFSGERLGDTPRVLRALKQNGVDYAYIKNLLGKCLATHVTCNSKFDAGQPKYMKVIDCKTRTIIDSPDEPYITLSYVWGPLESVIDKLPGALPATIEDAMTVTLELGFQYLWVDRYCIDQEDEDAAFHQIAQMDLIYSRSVLSIIACCGDDPNYGLPGVGSRPRCFSGYFETEKHYFQVITDEETSEIVTSNWNKRGWTLQEALFAPRRLAFTPYDSYLECMTCGTLESSLVSYYSCCVFAFRVSWLINE
jgi:hypothetical protein